MYAFGVVCVVEEEEEEEEVRKERKWWTEGMRRRMGNARKALRSTWRIYLTGAG